MNIFTTNTTLSKVKNKIIAWSCEYNCRGIDGCRDFKKCAEFRELNALLDSVLKKYRNTIKTKGEGKKMKPPTEICYVPQKSGRGYTYVRQGSELKRLERWIKTKQKEYDLNACVGQDAYTNYEEILEQINKIREGK